MNEIQQEQLPTPAPGALVRVQQDVTPMQMLAQAVQSGMSIETIRELRQLQKEFEADEARRAFVVGMTQFKANPPRITRDKAVDFTSSKGRTHYKHASLDSVSELIGAALSVVGISHRWETEQIVRGTIGKSELEGGMIKVTCILTHSLGHSERVTLQAWPDESGNKNNIQAVGSTVSYLQRYTLLTATGMAVHDADDDGRQGSKGMPDQAKADWLAAIDDCADSEAANALWQRIAKACAECGDVPAYDDLKQAMAAKARKLKSATKGEV